MGSIIKLESYKYKILILRENLRNFQYLNFNKNYKSPSQEIK